ncbi:MAG TPA: prefoldin domain-containing protein [Solirubrobacterales bacterium]
MAVMLPRETWTDKRLDERFDRIDERFDEIDKRLERIEGQISELRQTVSQMQRTMTTGFIGMAGLFCTAVVFFQ